jgi:lipoate-protein ligase B
VVIYTARLGLCDYHRVLRMQYAAHTHCVRTGHDVLLLTEHFPVITLGYRRPHEQLRLPAALFAERGIAVVETERGGGATYHGPGQFVAYPIFSSPVRRYGVRRFVENLEEVMRRVSRGFGVSADRRPGFPGLWVGRRKVGAVGIAVRRGVSLHGFALNVNLDLLPFSYIIPCGLADVEVTSLRRERGQDLTMAEVEEGICREFASVFAATLQEMPNEWRGVEREAGASTVDYDQPSRAPQRA